MIPTLLAGLLFGGSVYINGVKANSLRNFEIEDVDVRIDEQGNIYITAPNLIVEVAGQESTPAPEPEPTVPQSTVPEQPAPGPQPVVAPSSSSPAPDPQPVLEGEGSQGVQSAVTAPLSPPVSAIPAEAWWLIVEDNGSQGHALEIKVNGALVTNYSSGGAPVMIDLAPFLHPGENQVEVNALQTAGLGGGVLHVYVAPGENIDGVLTIAEPALVFSRRSSDDPAGATFRRQLTLP